MWFEVPQDGNRRADTGQEPARTMEVGGDPTRALTGDAGRGLVDGGESPLRRGGMTLPQLAPAALAHA